MYKRQDDKDGELAADHRKQTHEEEANNSDNPTNVNTNKKEVRDLPVETETDDDEKQAHNNENDMVTLRPIGASILLDNLEEEESNLTVEEPQQSSVSKKISAFF